MPPPLTKSLNQSFNFLWIRGSRSRNGSSMKSILGSWSMAAEMVVFFFIPLDRLMHRVVRLSSRPKNSIHLSTLPSSGNFRTAATKCRYSSTVRKLGGYSSSGTIPMAALTAMGSAAASIPITCAVPDVGGSCPLSICIVVVFPAPFGPMKPKNSPAFTCKSRPSTAVSSPNRFVRSCASIGINRFTC